MPRSAKRALPVILPTSFTSALKSRQDAAAHCTLHGGLTRFGEGVRELVSPVVVTRPDKEDGGIMETATVSGVCIPPRLHAAQAKGGKSYAGQKDGVMAGGVAGLAVRPGGAQ